METEIPAMSKDEVKVKKLLICEIGTCSSCKYENPCSDGTFCLVC